MNPDLLMLVDGRLPTGAHAYSAGVESAVRVGDVVDAATLARYLDERLAVTGRVDAAFTASACASARRGAGRDVFADLDAEYEARVLSPHLRSTSLRLGRQLLRVARALWPTAWPPGVALLEHPHHPLVLGVVVAAAGGAPGDAALITLHHLAAAVCTAGVRLLGLDPIEVAAIQSAALRRAAILLDDLGEWEDGPPSRLPADGGLLTEILGEHHRSIDGRMFAA